MKDRARPACMCLVLATLLMLFVSAALFSQDVPDPTCVECGGKNGEHDPSCPYYQHEPEAETDSDPEPVHKPAPPTKPDPKTPPPVTAGPSSGSTSTVLGTAAGSATTTKPTPTTTIRDPYTGGLKGRSQGTGTSGLKPAGSTQARGLKTYDATGRNIGVKAGVELGKMNPPLTINDVKAEIVRQQAEPDPICQAIASSLKSKIPPPPSQLRFPELRPGDVLLIAPERALTFGMWTGFYIKMFDKLTSMELESRASHTCIFVKEVRGVRYFLDNLPGEGPRIKNEDQIIWEYGNRGMDVARPVKKIDGQKLWEAAREVGIRQIDADLRKLGDAELLRRMNAWTNYGLYGHDNMVCSEASHWVLIQAGLDIAKTDSPFKKLLGIYYGPANFYSDETMHFLILPVGKMPKAGDQR